MEGSTGPESEKEMEEEDDAVLDMVGEEMKKKEEMERR